MALTYTPETELGSTCPPFQLTSVDHKPIGLDNFKDAKALLVMFICNHCPYVKAVEDRIIQLAREVQPQGVSVVAICANDPTENPEDSPEELRRRWEERQYPFPYLIDDSQAVARAFGAVCTPDFFLYDRHLKLFYRGRLDDSWKDSEKVRNQELKGAINAALKGQKAPSRQFPSMGCSIKWKS